MRIFLISMPFIALVAILAASTGRQLEYSAQGTIIANGKADPQIVAFFEKVRKAKATRDRQAALARKLKNRSESRPTH